MNAKITATIVKQSASIECFDDGKHADGAANDGIYGAATGKLTDGEYFVEAKAEADNQTKVAVAQITVGANSTTKAAIKPRRKS